MHHQTADHVQRHAGDVIGLRQVDDGLASPLPGAAIFPFAVQFGGIEIASDHH
jgi:hypothetical protein